MADTARQTSEAFGDLEFEYNLKQLLDKDPIAALGFDPAKASYTVPQGDKYGTKYSREEDTLFYGPDTGSSKDILVHEFRHRGHQLLKNEIEKNPEAFVKKYGQDVVDFLTGKFSETEGKLYPGDRQEEFRTELGDDLEATFNKPRPSEEKLLQGIKDSLGDSANLFNDEELMTLAVKNYVKNVDNTGYVKDTTELVTKEDQEKYKNILTKVRQAAFDIIEQRKGMAEGGKVGNMNMQKQMSLFEYGGIADDGMTKDPVSGNNVPPGSLAKEVRDDIPAMLSEGEYVVPADVLRFYGVNFFENLRGQAKQGLQSMEQNGRIGGTPMTQQDVARNMQQPVHAAQGAMMQSPMKIQQRPAPQAMGNSGMPMQGYSGEDGSVVTGDPRANQYRSGWSPARARFNTPMFQGTSSQVANVAAAAEAAEAEEITQFRTHYNQAGETAQVRYVGTTQENMRIAEGQDDIISEYPLTEQEYNAYKAEMSKGSGGEGGGGGGEDPTPTGSDTSWMDGINWGDTASVKEWVESDNGLGMSSAARKIGGMGGIIGAIPQAIQAQDIAKTRGIRSYYESIGDKEMVDYLDGKLKEALKETGLITSAFDKLGLLTGDNYLEQIKSFAPTSLDLQKTFTPEQRKQFTDTSGDMVKDEGGASVYKPGGIDVAMINTNDKEALTAAEQHAVNTSRARAAATQAAVESAYESGASTDDIAGLQAAVEEAGGTWATGGRAEGGLMTKGKPPKKKTMKYNKGGLAGKKK